MRFFDRLRQSLQSSHLDGPTQTWDEEMQRRKLVSDRRTGKITFEEYHRRRSLLPSSIDFRKAGRLLRTD